MAPLSDFEGLPVLQAGVEIPGAAGGLREAMEIEPQEFHKGEKVYVVIGCTVFRIRHDPIDKDDVDGDQRRVHIFRADSATIVDEQLVAKHLEDQAERIRLAKEGPSLFDGGDEAADLASAHDAGEHRELVDGCEECEHEAELVEAGE